MPGNGTQATPEMAEQLAELRLKEVKLNLPEWWPLRKAGKVRSAEWGCAIDGCEAHRRNHGNMANFRWRGSGAYRDRPLLCRLGIHRHWYFTENADVLGGKRCLCGYTWIYVA